MLTATRSVLRNALGDQKRTQQQQQQRQQEQEQQQEPAAMAKEATTALAAAKTAIVVGARSVTLSGCVSGRWRWSGMRLTGRKRSVRGSGYGSESGWSNSSAADTAAGGCSTGGWGCLL